MSRVLSLLFAVACYAIFFATFLYLIAFVGDFDFLPKTIDAPASGMTAGGAAIVDVALIALFGLQHSVMARPGFKRAWSKVIPTQAERSLFVLVSSVALLILFRFWQPIDSAVWDASGSAPLSMLLWALFWIGWGTVLLSTFLINHFELFGLQQAWLHMRAKQPHPPVMCEPSLYRFVRHPMMVGFFFALWAIPAMSAGHLLLAAGLSLYILIALHYEEKDLVGLFGADYEDYRGRVGMLLPRFKGRA